MRKNAFRLPLSLCVSLLCVSVLGLALFSSARAADPPGESSAHFPATGDTVSVMSDPYWWHAGDYAEGERTPGLPLVDGVILDLLVDDNTLTCDSLDFDLYIEGTSVGSFSVAGGETEHSEMIELATPIAGASPVTVRLEVNRSVAASCGSVIIPLDQSSITFIYAQGSDYFPELGDTRDVCYEPWWWQAGDNVEGVREPGPLQVDTLVYRYQFENGLKAPGGACGAGGEANLQFSINGTAVGEFTLGHAGGDSGEVMLTFDPISAVTYTVRMELINTVASGCGSLKIPSHQSTLQLLNSMASRTFPDTGDTVSVMCDPCWWHAGDYAEGPRLSLLSRLNAISYTLYYTNGLHAAGSGACSAGGQVPLALSVDGVVVATTVITPGSPEALTIIAAFDRTGGISHTLRLEETAQVAVGCGSIQVPVDLSPFHFNDTWRSRYFPTPGDDVPGDLDWGSIGSTGEGQRLPGPSEVNALVYSLRPGYVTPARAFTLTMKVNGTAVGSLRVDSATPNVDRTFNFAPFSGPVYTVTMETTARSGAGSITIPYDRSQLRLVNTLDSRFFPALGDFVLAPGDWNGIGIVDRAVGVRQPAGLSQVSALVYDLRAFANTLTGTLTLRFRINDISVGDFDLHPGETFTQTTLTFPPLTSPSGIYTVALQTVNSAGGSVVLPLNRSRLILGDPFNADTFPASGDLLNEGSNPGWDQVGDFAQGVRTPGLPFINHLQYVLRTFPNSLTCTLTTTLRLNGTPVAVIPIVGGTTLYTVTEDFAPVAAVGGRYTVTLRAMNSVSPACGDTYVPFDISPLRLSYVLSPSAGFVGLSPLSGYAPLTVTLVASSTGVIGPSYDWEFGDGGTGSGKVTQHTYTVAGTYPVTLAVAGGGGPVVVARLAYVQVDAPISPTADFVGVPTAGSAPLLVVFTPTVSGPASSYLWDLGDGNTSVVVAPSHIYTAPGSYTVTLTVSGSGGSDAETKPSYVIVAPPGAPDADFSANPTAGTAPLTVTFTSIVTGPVTAYAWDFGDGGASATTNPVHTYADVGLYTVVFTASNSYGSRRVSKLNYVVVSPPPPPTVDLSASPTTGPAPLIVYFTGVVSGTADSYAWDLGDGTIISNAHPDHIHTYWVPGVYTVTFTATGPGGSGEERKVGYITVTAVGLAPEASFVAAPVAGLGPLVVSFTPTLTGTVAICTWDFGDLSTSDLLFPVHTYTTPGVYTITLAVGGPGGTDSFVRTDYVTVNYGIYLPLLLRNN